MEDVADTRMTDLFITEREDKGGGCVCGGGGKEGWGGRCGLHKDKIIINNKEGRNKKGGGVW